MTDIEKLRAMIASHHRIVFFGGAGVSTESNIPDFRGANGLYRQKTNLPWTPEEMLSHHFYEEHPVEFFTMYKQFAEAMLKASPNRAHFALAKLEQEGGSLPSSRRTSMVSISARGAGMSSRSTAPS